MTGFRGFVKGQSFRPTASMLIFAQEMAENSNSSQRALAKSTGVHEALISRWKATPGFNEWLEEYLVVLRAPMHKRLEAIGMKKAETDFQYYKLIAEKYGYVEKEQSKYMLTKMEMPTKEQILELLADAKTNETKVST